MEIIKKGKLPEDKSYRGECHNCKTIFKFNYNEGEYFSNQRDGAGFKVICPLCKEPLYVYPRELNLASCNGKSYGDKEDCGDQELNR